MAEAEVALAPARTPAVAGCLNGAVALKGGLVNAANLVSSCKPFMAHVPLPLHARVRSCSKPGIAGNGPVLLNTAIAHGTSLHHDLRSGRPSRPGETRELRTAASAGERVGFGADEGTGSWSGSGSGGFGGRDRDQRRSQSGEVYSDRGPD